jgi:hypothetical protein
MSQQLVPVTGGSQTITTTPNIPQVNFLSPQYIQAKKLEQRPTEWQVYRRPIYRRLPAVSQTYQIDFFDILPVTNTATSLVASQDVGYVYIPWGEGIFGPISLEVIASDTLEDLIIKSGQVVWKYGTTSVPPAIVNLKEVDIDSGRYLVTYQLIHDNPYIENLYRVTDYSLSGTKLIITSSSDGTVGWRYPVVNAFENTTSYWSNSDTYFPDYAQPSEAFLQWESNETFQASPLDPASYLASAYTQVILRCPTNTSFTGTATLSYVNSAEVTEVSQVSISKDTVGQYFQFDISTPSFQKGWRVDFSDLKIKIQSMTISGVITKISQQAESSTRCALSIYPAESVPSTALNSKGEKVPATYCDLAYIDVDANFKLIDIKDIRSIIHRDYQPVADWLTRPFDEDLVNFYDQVKGYATLWMNPATCVTEEYAYLPKYGVELTK